MKNKNRYLSDVLNYYRGTEGKGLDLVKTFRSQDNELTRRVMNSQLFNKREVVILIETEDGSVFGTFHRDFPGKTNDEEWQEDSDFFIFTLYKNKEKNLHYYKRKGGKESVNFFDDPSRTASYLSVFCAFELNKNTKIEKDFSHGDSYGDGAGYDQHGCACRTGNW